MHKTRMDRRCLTGGGGYVRSPVPSLSVTKAECWLVPNKLWLSFNETTTSTTEAAFGKCRSLWLNEKRWSRSLKTQTWSWRSLISLALYRHPTRMNSALHKSTREKYWFYTIHFLKYIQSKISYVSIMSCSQSALLCNYMHVCERIYQNIQYMSHSLKAATYLVKEWDLREDLLKGLSSQRRSINRYISLFTLPEASHRVTITC